jgi:hypothetical protein
MGMVVFVEKAPSSIEAKVRNVPVVESKNKFTPHGELINPAPST